MKQEFAPSAVTARVQAAALAEAESAYVAAQAEVARLQAELAPAVVVGRLKDAIAKRVQERIEGLVQRSQRKAAIQTAKRDIVKATIRIEELKSRQQSQRGSVK